MTISFGDFEGRIASAAPIEKPCLSYWQRTTRAYAHLNSNKKLPVPSRCKYVVIGSGIAGALAAFELTENGVEGKDIVILEAREAAGGASSRNAGHVRPDAFRGYSHYAGIHGSEQALKIIANERLVLQKVDEFVQKYNVPCDFTLSSTFDVCMTAEFAEYEAQSFEAYKEAGGDVSHIKFYGGEEAAKRTRVQRAITAYEWPAGTSHPAKLAQWLLTAAIERGAMLFTHCPVSRVMRANDQKSWDVHTPRGVLTSPTIMHCTNAYAALLLPQLENHLTPNRAQAQSLIAPPALSGTETLNSTFSLRYSLEHFYSVIQRRGDGTVILGVSRLNPTLSTETFRTLVTFDDTSYNQEIAEDALKQFRNIFMGDEGKLSSVHGGGFDHAWTGIVAMTGDKVPFVGSVEGLDGQWVCAGFGAHGMARIFTCAPGVVKLVLGKDWRETGLPECFQMSNTRLQKMSKDAASSYGGEKKHGIKASKL